ncbi:TetR family transcriptional regulator [Pantoea alhagi]|uniref:TetR family transcriptional regulator n=1 Tax=Pantoea alhagi TaxID=1891675 RepID=A0A1W6B7E6_9GAMM|nr:TetR/AcrR family transcriptional regulator [Pantoea alhagi]ARJ43002.1 TetR family transcriptional regulator [Pantoea alhagi]
MKTPAVPLNPRKAPAQARSVATVAALHTATLQVLTREGLSRCTTTRVARRAGMSVGSLYQYYPNRDALLSGVLALHLNHVAASIEQACATARGKSVADMATALVKAFLAAKLANPEESKALYSIAAERGGSRVVAAVHKRMVDAVVDMLLSSPGITCADPRFTAHVALGMITGPVKGFLEGLIPQEFAERFPEHLSSVLADYFRKIA